MNAYGIIFLVFTAALLLLLPRRWAALPLLIGACYIIRQQGIELGPFHFTMIRILVAVGAARIVLRGERLAGGMNAMDRLMLAWSAWLLVSSAFHDDPSAALIYRLGVAYDALGIYFLLRIFCQSLDDVVWLCRATAILLLPIALEMIYEKLTVTNLFSVLGEGSVSAAIRDGKIRARGPFAHPILAGTVGAVCLPLIVPLWRQHRRAVIIGTAACLVMVLTSTSSGPILSTMAAIGALYMWHYRGRMRLVRWLAVMSYIALDLIMKDSAYFVMARIDLTGSSTGWHRAKLIQSAIAHLPEWWLGGTDYTRHWMPTGVMWSADHTDITNHYLHMGVIGGLPLMVLFIAILVKGFAVVGRILRQSNGLPQSYRFMVWALGASLFAHAVTFISVSYYDQSFLFIYLSLALISSMHYAAAKLKEAGSIDQHNLGEIRYEPIQA